MGQTAVSAARNRQKSETPLPHCQAQEAPPAGSGPLLVLRENFEVSSVDDVVAAGPLDQAEHC
eukprot:15092704-Alexandrium_andersonii.AAC.1